MRKDSSAVALRCLQRTDCHEQGHSAADGPPRKGGGRRGRPAELGVWTFSKTSDAHQETVCKFVQTNAKRRPRLS